jgi:hypothetical protein
VASVFISHSQYDIQIIDFFKRTIRSIPRLEPTLMELENLNHKNAGIVIKDLIKNDCIGLVVLLGERVLFPHGINPSFTHSWVGFEVGVAASRGKPIIVFEDYEDPIEYPVPYLDHFVRYKQDKDHSRYIGQILRYNMPIQQAIAPYKIRCPYTHCNAVYSYWSIRNRMHCPACRGIFTPGADRILTRGNTDQFMPSNV